MSSRLNGEQYCRWIDSSVLWAWPFCWTRGEGCLQWRTNILLFGCVALGQGWDAGRSWTLRSDVLQISFIHLCTGYWGYLLALISPIISLSTLLPWHTPASICLKGPAQVPSELDVVSLGTDSLPYVDSKSPLVVTLILAAFLHLGKGSWKLIGLSRENGLPPSSLPAFFL